MTELKTAAAVPSDSRQENSTASLESGESSQDEHDGSTPGVKKRKRRPIGVYVCDHDGCDKRFTRAEHLSRHKLNHNPTVIYSCPWPGCTKSFVRSDLRERHLKRHQARRAKEQAKAMNAANAPKKRRPKRVAPPLTPSTSVEKKEPSINSLDPVILPTIEDRQLGMHSYSQLTPQEQDLQVLKSECESPILPRPSAMAQSAPSPARLINWLFDENSVTDVGLLDSVPHMSNGNFFNPEDDPFGLSSDLINDILIIPPNFPSPSQQTEVTSEITQRLIQAIPQLAGHKHLRNIPSFLEAYWSCFHTQSPILHKPSFNSNTCPTILLLSMIMIGSSYYTAHPSASMITNPRQFGDLIAVPLRGMIFHSRDFQPPSPVWIIQSLLMLEHYERFTSNRQLHERAFVHHGTTIQLLRRSPGFGGNPLNNKTEYEKSKSHTIWERWIEFEQLKRTALYAFYVDTSDSMVFGYQLMLSTHQIQLRLPCDEELWESYLTPKEIPSTTEQLPFISGLKKLLNREPVHTSRFGKKLLLSGLLSIMSQMQQRSIQGTILDIDDVRDTWQESLSFAFDYWNREIVHGCCSTSSALYWRDDDKSQLPLSLRYDDTRCKFPVYHMAQITLRIQHYDYYIYAGAPWRMNVEAEASDYEAVGKKIKEWSGSHNGRLSVVYAYMFLFEVFLSPQDSATQFEYKFHADDDAIHERLNVLALVMLLVWAYNYSVDGPESEVLLHKPPSNTLVSKESGIEHLRRIRAELSTLIGMPIHVSNPGSGLRYHNTMIELANKLAEVKNKHHMTGLLHMISELFKGSYWEVGDEFSRLVKNCYWRSFGSMKVRCDDMYKSSSSRA